MRFCSMFVLLYIVRKLEKAKEGCQLEGRLAVEGSSTRVPQTTLAQGRQNVGLFRTLLKIVLK
ncbi:hypothetical protein M5D96_009256 [Drosophila gunungcola]|uniref:Uncharacterized protein n=1 Tax=Drosophila gunungcola TaxID=103775 RepID=A0A9P9YJ49_9MUSC|nr:hypothetical protein M5D96_009256 [Drosophila gunungcola]